jgi:hypothetical protein
VPSIELSVQLYQTEQMEEVVANLYAHIILFFQRAVKWYSKSSAGRALASILKLFELEYQDTVDQIKICSETVNNIAHGAARAETRDMHITVQMIYGNLQGMQRKLHEMQVQLDEKGLKITSCLDQVLQVAISSKAISEAIQLDVSDMKPRMIDLQFMKIYDMLSPDVNPDTLLKRHTALARSRRQTSAGHIQASVDIPKLLGQWMSAVGSSLFILRSGPRASAITRDHAINIINYLRSAHYKVFWILSPTSACDSEPSMMNILRSLVYQVIHHDPNILLRFPENLNGQQFLSNRSESEWLDLLCLLISRLDKCFLIVETEDLYQASRQKPEWPQQFLQVFRRLMGSAEASGSLIKILVATFDCCTSPIAIQQEAFTSFVATVQKPCVVPPRLRRGMSRPKWRGFAQPVSRSSS